jgi:archaetidylinositol phosphate synthase
MTVAVFRPLGRVLVTALLPLRVPPVAVVVANGVAGVAAAVAAGRGNLVAAAVLLQLKTVLDNADGQLARAAGRISALGRYLDTEIDLLVNAAVFVALAHVTGSNGLAVAGFCALTLVLSADFNADVLYRRARGEDVVTQPPTDDEGWATRVLAALYRVVFAPQDRFLQAVSGIRLNRAARRVAGAAPIERLLLVYHDSVTVGVLSNLGLSTQLTALGLCLVAGKPIVYLWFTLGCVALLPFLQLRRELLVRRALFA